MAGSCKNNDRRSDAPGLRRTKDMTGSNIVGMKPDMGTNEHFLPLTGG